MAGTRDRNLRRGDLCEGIGLELLRPFALVAPTPRTEDVGADAVATLTKREGRRLIAEDSFLVQVKAASVRKLEFKDESLSWLRALRLPFYLLSVDLATSTLELRSIINACGHTDYPDCTSVTMYLEDTPFDLTDWEMHVWLGQPILRWIPTDAADPAFQQLAYDILKTWVVFESENIGLRALGMTRGIGWETNRKPVPTGSYAIMHRPEELQTVLQEVSPYLKRLMAMVFPSDAESDELLTGLFLVSQFMRRHGVDPDPADVLGTIGRVRAKAGQPKPPS